MQAGRTSSRRLLRPFRLTSLDTFVACMSRKALKDFRCSSDKSLKYSERGLLSTYIVCLKLTVCLPVYIRNTSRLG